MNLFCLLLMVRTDPVAGVMGGGAHLCIYPLGTIHYVRMQQQTAFSAIAPSPHNLYRHQGGIIFGDKLYVLVFELC